MIRTKAIKIWALVTHAFIVIGMGHGILTLGILEVISLATLFDKAWAQNDGDVSAMSLRLVTLLSLAGQVAIIASFYVKRKTTELGLHVPGLLLLWASVLVYAYGICNDRYAHLAVVSCLPLLYVTIRTFAGGHIQKLWSRALEKL